MTAESEKIGAVVEAIEVGSRVDLRHRRPPRSWGVRVEEEAIEGLASGWAGEDFPLPGWDGPGLPATRTSAGWYDFCGVAVSVMACLWPRDGEAPFSVEHQGRRLVDAPALFACFTRAFEPTREGLDLGIFRGWGERDAEEFFRGAGCLQLIPERRRRLSEVAVAVEALWDGHFFNLVEEAGFDAGRVVALLVETIPGYLDEPRTERGLLPFNKRAHLAAAMMAAGVASPRIEGVERFPVYADYILPMVLRRHGVLVYAEPLAEAVDSGRPIAAGSRWENGIRWATVYAAERLRRALAAEGRKVTTPALDHFLWHRGVLGPEAGSMGAHHRTLTLAY